MARTYSDRYAQLEPDAQAAAYFNDLPGVIQAHILAQEEPPGTLEMLQRLAKEADYIF